MQSPGLTMMKSYEKADKSYVNISFSSSSNYFSLYLSAKAEPTPLAPVLACDSTLLINY